MPKSIIRPLAASGVTLLFAALSAYHGDPMPNWAVVMMYFVIWTSMKVKE